MVDKSISRGNRLSIPQRERFHIVHFHRDKRTLSWENGRREGISKGRFPWSTEGARGRQPDGPGGASFGSENCLAILNNVYNDRVKFHDVGCEHRKPTVCE